MTRSTILLVVFLLSPHPSQAADPSDPVQAKLVQRYDRILIEPLQLIDAVETLETGDTADRQIVSSVEPKDVERAREQFSAAFNRELKEVFDVVLVPGTRTLRLDAMLIGLSIDRQAWLAPATRVFKTVDPVTLVIVIRDSVTGEVIQRLAIEDGPVANSLQLETASIFWEHIRKVFRRLAIRVRWLLADLPAPQG